VKRKAERSTIERVKSTKTRFYAASRLFQSKKEGHREYHGLDPGKFSPGPQYLSVATLKSIRKISVSLNVLFTYFFSTRSSSVTTTSSERRIAKMFPS
jgi:hypothetical protein